ncbi:MAG: hypothetical protein M1821_007982 [Bathelium mastoideum]|nr:MAG: hypothetical protein M1821_007982 [Bathelium mastoideum]KAI9693028.1 MAG: hypothetical protein M1822_005023 [Bathelium mastoideum]
MSAEFQKSATDVKNLNSSPNNDELLRLYGLYKIANGENFTSASAPGAFDFKGKAKYNQWKKFHDDGVTKADAEKQYVELVGSLKQKYGFKA